MEATRFAARSRRCRINNLELRRTVVDGLINSTHRSLPARPWARAH
jgi:hypothetical protein